MTDLARDLQRQGFELIETHISRVFLGEADVYKVKKPVNLGFLDFSTLAARKRDCEAEVTLNRRLAATTYVGIVPITRTDDGVHRIAETADADGEVVEWAVHMRRLDQRDAADARLERGELTRADVERIAEHIADFHAQARCDEETRAFGASAQIEGNVRENFEQTTKSALHYLSEAELAAIKRFQLGFLADNGQRFAERMRADKVRDGHGDLRLEHVYLPHDGSIEVIDCIEFNDRFRYGDVCADIAFLSMDLLWHDRLDLSEALLFAYARVSNDYDLYGVVDFYESYRAYVRGKVTSFLAEDEGASEGARQRAAEQARRYYLLAEACAKPPLEAPVLYGVGGLIASGKSTFAAGLSARTHAPVIEADRTRKHLLGLGATERAHTAAFDGAYGPAQTERVYAEILRRAAVVLDSGRPAIVDASFRSQAHRQALAALAHARGIACVFIECHVPREVAMARLSEREQEATTSDGRRAIYDDFAASYEPVGPLSGARRLRVDTRQALEDQLSQALAAPQA